MLTKKKVSQDIVSPGEAALRNWKLFRALTLTDLSDEWRKRGNKRLLIAKDKKKGLDETLKPYRTLIVRWCAELISIFIFARVNRLVWPGIRFAWIRSNHKFLDCQHFQPDEVLHQHSLLHANSFKLIRLGNYVSVLNVPEKSRKTWSLLMHQHVRRINPHNVSM